MPPQTDAVDAPVVTRAPSVVPEPAGVPVEELEAPEVNPAIIKSAATPKPVTPPMTRAPSGAMATEGAPPDEPSSGVPTPAPAEPIRTLPGNGWKARLRDALATMARGFAVPIQQTGDARFDFFQRLGGGAGGFGLGLIDPDVHHELTYREKLAQYDERRRNEAELATIGQRARLTEAQIGNLEADNKRADATAKIAAEDKAYDRTHKERTASETERHNRAMENKPTRAPSTVQTTTDKDGNLLERDPVTNEWVPAKRQGGGNVTRPTRQPSGHLSASDRSLAKERAKIRVNKEYTGSHISSMIDDYAKGLYSTYAQEAGINWEDEQAAKSEGAAPDEPDYSGMSADEVASALPKLLAGGQTKTKGPIIRAVQARARKEAEAIVKRDLEALESKYFEEEMGKFGSGATSTAPTRVPSQPKGGTYPASKLAEGAREEKMTINEFRKFLGSQGISINEHK